MRTEYKISPQEIKSAPTLNQVRKYMKDIMNIEKESANEQRAKRIRANYQPYWIKQ